MQRLRNNKKMFLLDKQEVRQKIASLTKQINKHSHAYHVLDRPIIPDAEYDKLFQELVLLEQQYPELAQLDSPTKREIGRASCRERVETTEEKSGVERTK